MILTIAASSSGLRPTHRAEDAHDMDGHKTFARWDTNSLCIYSMR
jgi:hypothetical protein